MIAGPIQIDIISGSAPHPPPGMPGCPSLAPLLLKQWNDWLLFQPNHSFLAAHVLDKPLMTSASHQKFIVH